jgi:hypothetical protein
MADRTSSASECPSAAAARGTGWIHTLCATPPMSNFRQRPLNPAPIDLRREAEAFRAPQLRVCGTDAAARRHQAQSPILRVLPFRFGFPDVPLRQLKRLGSWGSLRPRWAGAGERAHVATRFWTERPAVIDPAPQMLSSRSVSPVQNPVVFLWITLWISGDAIVAVAPIEGGSGAGGAGVARQGAFAIQGPFHVKHP